MGKLEDLDAKIRQAREKSEEPPASKVHNAINDSNSRMGIQAGMEFVGSIAVGAAIGYGLDQWLETKPVFFLIMFFLGIFTGFFNVYRVTQNMGSAVGFSQLHKAEKAAKTAANTDEDTEED